MKKLMYFLAAALLLGCAREEQMNQEELPLTPKVYHVNLAFAGEVANEVEVSRDPLSKAGEVDTNDIYIINVYHKPPLESGYSKYAYGVFDRLENMSLDLYEGTLYQFKATLIKDGKDKLKMYYDNTFHWGGDNKTAELENQFIIGDWDFVSYDADRGPIYVKINDVDVEYQKMPKWIRYYGELTDYEPSENAIVSINLFKAICGVKINVTGLTEGTLNFNMNYASGITIQSDSLYTPDVIYQCANGVSLGSMITAINNSESYRIRNRTSITWTDATGSRSVKILDEEITYTRLERTIFNVTLKQGAVEQGNVEFNIEQEEIADGEIHDLEGSISGVEN